MPAINLSSAEISSGSRFSSTASSRLALYEASLAAESFAARSVCRMSSARRTSGTTLDAPSVRTGMISVRRLTRSSPAVQETSTNPTASGPGGSRSSSNSEYHRPLSIPPITYSSRRSRIAPRYLPCGWNSQASPHATSVEKEASSWRRYRPTADSPLQHGRTSA